MTQNNAAPAAANAKEMVAAKKTSLLATMAARFNVDPVAFHNTIVQTVIKGKDGKMPTNEQVIAFLVVANQYKLNPFTREIHAFVKGGAVVPIVGIDGWCNLVNRHKEFDGCALTENNDADGKLVSVTCTMYRKDRQHPIVLTETLGECRGASDIWKKWPRRMLRHKTYIQAARYCFGFAGIYDEDEADRIEAAGIDDAEVADVVEIDMKAGPDDAHSGGFDDAPKPDDFKPPPDNPEPPTAAPAARSKGKARKQSTPVPKAPESAPNAASGPPAAKTPAEPDENSHAADVRLLWNRAYLRAEAKGVMVDQIVSECCVLASGGTAEQPQRLTPEQLATAITEAERWEASEARDDRRANLETSAGNELGAYGGP